jgi:transcriptional regulator GlxA family with amidase domain
MIRVTVVLLEGGLPSTSITPIEIFGSAGVLWNALTGEEGEPYFSVRTASLDGRPVRTATSLVLRPDCSIAEVGETELVFVPAIRADLGAALAASAPLLPWLRHWHEEGAAIAAVCTGAALLAEAELLDGRPATTHWAFGEICRQRYPRVHWQIERMVTDSENVLCGGGVYASIDLSLHLVERYCGHRIAMQTAKALLLQTPRTWQAAYAADPPRAAQGDQEIQRAQEWLLRNFAGEVRVEELAARVGMSPRTFARRFKAATGETPLAYLHALRISSARQLLEYDLKPVRQVSREVGYEDLTFFRRLFKRHTGLPPRAYRERFGPGAAARGVGTGGRGGEAGAG